MSLRPIYGHRALLDRLAGALASSRFPQAALLVGPAGVGKQRLALWVARGLLCESGPAAPCGACTACHQVMGLAHPDLHWLVPIPRPKGSDKNKQVAEAEESLGQVMEQRRRDPLWQRPDGLASHSLASVRLLHRQLRLTPFSGDRKVFILGDAERLVAQESSPEAANALLKVLEEPPADTTIVLTASDPHALLPTVQSRVVAIRVPRVSDDDVREFLTREVTPPVEGVALERLTLLAEGCIGRAIERGAGPNGPDRAATELLAAVRKGGGGWLPIGLAQQPWAARGEFTALLDALAVRLRADLARESERGGPQVTGRIEALKRVREARTAAQGNVNPQLALAVLADELEELL